MKQCAGFFRRLLGVVAQSIVGQRSRGEHDHAYPMFQKPHEVLAHCLVRGRLEHDVRLLLKQMFATHDVRQFELARERRTARSSATAAKRHEFDARELAGSRLLQNEACNSAASQHGYPDFVLQLV